MTPKKHTHETTTLTPFFIRGIARLFLQGITSSNSTGIKRVSVIFTIQTGIILGFSLMFAEKEKT
jgi:hypothetical protein